MIVKFLLEMKCCFKTICETIVSISSRHSWIVQCTSNAFLWIRIFPICVYIGCFADKFVDGTPHLGVMLVHIFSSGTEITDASYSQQSQTIKPLYCYNNLIRQQGNCILQRWYHSLFCLCQPPLILFPFSLMLYFLL